MKTLLLLALAGLPVCLQAQSNTRSPLRMYGQGCGPLLSGKFQPGRLDLVLSQAPKSAPGVLALGLIPLSVPMPTPGCTLLVRPDMLMLIKSDAAGVWKTSLTALPAVTTPVYSQALFLGAGPTWVASRGMKIGPQGTLRSPKEDFGNLAQRDDLRDGAKWIKGNLLAGVVGGSGMHGDFDVRVLAKDTGKKDPAGRNIYEMDAGNSQIPADRTLNGKTISVTDGRFEFLNFHLRSNEHLRFTGTTIPAIRATGEIRIEGVLSVSAPKATIDSLGSKATKGQKGHPGGPGGASGGRGGDTLSVTKGNVHGSAGSDLIYPKGHPFSARYKGTGGGGSLANPTTFKGIKYSFFDVICQQVSAGGGGGGFFDPAGKNKGGSGGIAVKNKNAPSSPPKAYDFGTPSKGGISVPLQSLVLGQNQPSTDLFLIGGSGGGGAGFHPVGSIDKSTSYRHAGSGGAGGGGALLLKAGFSLVVAKTGEVHADGASGQVTAYSSSDFSPSPGGAGSGGSILFQTGNTVSITGMVTSLGGKGGFTDNSGTTGSGFTAVDSASGEGAPGYLRFQAPIRPWFSKLTNIKPPVGTSNLARLLSPDYDSMTGAMSRWYDTGSLHSPDYEGYVIQAKIGGTPITLSHDPKLGSRANTGPILLQVQGVRLDPKTRKAIPGTETSWIFEDVSKLSNYAAQGYRFRLVFDRKASFGIAITVQSLEIRYVR